MPTKIKGIGTGYWRHDPETGEMTWIEQGESSLPKIYASSQQFKLLKRYIEEGSLGKKQLTTDLWFTGQQARELGYDIPEEDDFLLTPTKKKEGVLYGGVPLPTIPTTPIIETKLPDISQTIKNIYPEIPELKIQDIEQFARDSPDDFLQSISTIPSSDATSLLKALGATPQDIEELTSLTLPNLYRKALPLLVTAENADKMMDYFKSNPAILRRNLITVGLNPNTKALVKSLYPQITDRALDAYFNSGMPGMTIGGTFAPEFGFAPGAREIKTAPVTFLENPALWWQQYSEKYREKLPLEQQAAAIRQETLANTPGIIGLVNRPLWQGGLSAEDIVGIGLLAYGSYQAAKVGWDFFLRSSLLRNLNSWAKSAGVNIPDETKNNFINQAMANLSKKYLSQQAIKTIFNPTKTGFRATPTVVHQADTEINALVQREARALIPRATQTGALALGGKVAKPDMVGLIVGKIIGGVPLAPEEEQFQVNNKVAIEDALKVQAEVIPTKPITPVPSVTPERVVKDGEVAAAPEKVTPPIGEGKVQLPTPEEIQWRFPTADDFYFWARKNNLSEQQGNQLWNAAKEAKKILQGKKPTVAIPKAEIPKVGKIIPKEVTPAPEVGQSLIEKVRTALVETNKADEVMAVLPDGTGLTGREFKGIGAFQHLAEDLPNVQRWLDAGIVRTGLEADGTFFIEVRGGLSQKQFSKLSKLMATARNVRVDFGYFENEIVESFGGTPNTVRTQLRKLIGEPGFPKGYGEPVAIPKAEAGMPDAVKASEDRVVMPPPPPKEPPPSGPPPTHPPQPAPVEQGRITMPDLQAPQTVVDMYSRPDFWRRVGNLPLVKKAVGLFNPAAVANDPAKQAIILRVALKDEGAQKAQAVMSHLWEIGTQERVWGKTDEKGLLTSKPFTGISIDDIRQNPSKFSAQMTPQQREWIKRASEIEKVKLEALKRNGIDINELSFEDGGEYAGRRVMGKFNDAGELIESGRIAAGGRVGAKQPFEKTRIFKTAEEGILANYRYMNSDEALYYNTLGAYNKIADRQMAEWILSKVDWRTTKAPEALVLQAEAARLRLRKAQQLAAALNRAVRGERVPSATINSIASVYADQADTLKTLIPELQKPSPETGDIVSTLDKEAKALISEARLEYYQAINERARAREEAMRVKYEEASIAHPAFAGKIFTGAEAKEIADILNRGLTPQYIEALGDINKVNAIGRFFMLAGDASPMAIQLQFLAFYRPKAYAKAWGGFVRAMFDPEFQYRYYANNRDLINRHPSLILSGRGTEFTEFMGRGGLGKKLGVLAKPLVPFQKAFEGALDTAGIELAKSLDHLATTPERTLEVDQFINEFRGITSSARIGVSSTQRQAETALLLAPRYNRAIAAYLFDIVHGGLRGHQARMSLAQGFAGLSAMAVAISLALGEDEDEIWEHFNPESPKFFTWDVFGVEVGLGGKVRSILKTFGNMTRTGEIGQPALNFLRGNLSPGASTGLDLLTGKNYIGEPTRDNILDFTKTVGRNFMMIWTQTFLMEGGTLKDKAIIATAEFLGLRGYDISAKKELKIKDLEDRLGEQVGKTPMLTKKKPDIWDTRNMYSAVKRILERERPEDVLADKGYAGWGHLVIRIQQSEANTLPNIAFKDYNFDKTKGDTFADYMAQWAERQRIEEAGERATYTRVKIVEGKEERTTFKGLEALNAHKVDYPNAQRGNLSKRDRELLLEYNAAVDKKQFIKDHPEIEVNKLTDWLKSHPRENAEFALVGLADILSKEAYNQYKKLIVEMDTPDAALLKKILPPETSLDTHFTYLDMVSAGTHGSWEAQLLLKQDAIKAKEAGVQSYVDWRTKEGEALKLSDTPIASLEIKATPDYHDIWNKLNKEDDPDWVGNLDDKVKDKDGLTARDRAIAELKATKIGDMTWIDLDRKITAIEKGTDENPIPSEIVDAYIKHYQIVDQTSGNSAEAKLNRYDNPELNDFLMNEDYWDKPAEPLDEDRFYLDNYLVPRWRIEVDENYKAKDAEYNAIKNPIEAEQDRLRAEWLARPENADYRKNKKRKEAYELNNTVTGVRLPIDQIENYVAFNEIPQKGKRRERFVVENPEFAEAMFAITGKDIYKTRPEDVPNVAYDDIYDKYKDKFDKYDGLADNTSKFYIENPKDRQNERDNMMFTMTTQTYSGLPVPSKQLTEFGLAYYRREAYSKFIPKEYVEDYVGYSQKQSEGKPANWKLYTGTDEYYEDDWWMQEHPEFYKEVWLGILGNQRNDYRTVPTRQVFSQYIGYLDRAHGIDREDFRWNLWRNGQPDFENWLLLTGKVTQHIRDKQRIKEERDLTPAEQAQLERDRQDKIIQDKLNEIDRILARKRG